ALARSPDARAVERLCEIVHDGVIPGGLDRDRNARGFPAPQERADLAERRDDHHPDEDDEKRERVRIAAEDRRGERASSWALALVRQARRERAVCKRKQDREDEHHQAHPTLQPIRDREEAEQERSEGWEGDAREDDRPQKRRQCHAREVQLPVLRYSSEEHDG